MLKKVISGGQTGVDQAALWAAQAVGIETSGWMPQGYMTLDGPAPNIASAYGMLEHDSYRYPPRTYCNVRDSHGTLRIAGNFSSAGERCTMRAILYYERPFLDVNVERPPSCAVVADWIMENNIEVLNVAGNSEATCPGIYEFSATFLERVFRYTLQKQP